MAEPLRRAGLRGIFNVDTSLYCSGPIMNATIQKWGNSLALRIPAAVARDTCLVNGSVVTLVAEEGRIVIEPVRRAKYNLDDLLEQVSESNLHPGVDTGPSVGQEVW
jgi:antitoxin MazE